jgi:hypothetical protein
MILVAQPVYMVSVPREESVILEIPAWKYRTLLHRAESLSVSGAYF